MMKKTITEKELKVAQEQKVQFIKDTDNYEEVMYQEDKALIYYSQIALYKYFNVLEFAKKKLSKGDFEQFCELLREQNEAIFEEYERLNYLYYKFGGTVKK